MHVWMIYRYDFISIQPVLTRKFNSFTAKYFQQSPLTNSMMIKYKKHDESYYKLRFITAEVRFKKNKNVYNFRKIVKYST